MKNQNDLIFSIVAVVVLLIVFGCCFGMQPKPIAPSAPAAVNLATPEVPTDTKPVMANSLPASGSNNGMGGGMSMMGGGGRPAMGGPGAAPGASGGSPVMMSGAAGGGGGGTMSSKPGK